MKADHDLRDISSVHMAMVTGHKLTNIERVPSVFGPTLVCKLDGKFMKMSDARKILESQYTSKPNWG